MRSVQHTHINMKALYFPPDWDRSRVELWIDNHNAKEIEGCKVSGIDHSGAGSAIRFSDGRSWRVLRDALDADFVDAFGNISTTTEVCANGFFACLLAMGLVAAMGYGRFQQHMGGAALCIPVVVFFDRARRRQLDRAEAWHEADRTEASAGAGS